MWRETSGHHLCFLREKTRSGEACTGTMRRFSPDISVPTLILQRAICTEKDMKREANGFCACPLPVHCKDLHNQNIHERLIPIFDRIGESIPGYRRGLRWCNRCYQTADQHFNNLPDYQPPRKVFFIPFFKMTHLKLCLSTIQILIGIIFYTFQRHPYLQSHRTDKCWMYNIPYKLGEFLNQT